LLVARGQQFAVTQSRPNIIVAWYVGYYVRVL